MAFDVKVPAVGESVQEAMIYKWHKNDGESIARDEVLLELETDKATVEIVAETSGVVTRKKKEGETVRVGDVLASIDESGKAVDSKAKAAAPQKDSAKTEVAPAVKSPAATSADLSPAVSRMVAEKSLNPNDIAATGRGGRITKEDVVNHLEKPASVSAKATTPSTQSIPSTTAVVSKPAAAGSRVTSRQPMSMLRRRIAERLLEAQETNAILTTFNEVDMTAVMALRTQYKDKFKEKHGVGLGFMSFFVKACIEALKAFPAVNGHIEGNEIVTHNFYDIGVAISTDRGLMVPVIRDADSLSFAGVEKAIAEFAAKGRSGKIAIEDLAGGTFTVTNGGTFGSLLSTPIINPPQSAILGMHKIQERPMVMNGQIVARPMMYLAMSYDHRIIDGKEAVTFLVKIKDCLEDPSRLLLEV